MRILVIRRDNIGDLVCTTPLMTALRRRHPKAWIGALVNSYNAPVLAGNPDLDEVVVYTKLKHLGAGESGLAAFARRIASLWRLRRAGLDAAVLATPDFVPRVARQARWLAPREVVGFSDGSAEAARLLDASVPTSRLGALHEVERVFALAAHFGIAGEIPRLTVAADPAEREKASRQFKASGPRIAVHISARRPTQRWAAERYAALIGRLHREHGTAAMLLWFPGDPSDPRHPGDDAKAEEIARLVGDQAPLAAYRAGPLRELIGALAACDAVITPDGGAMHLAAGLGKPTLAFFGDVSPERWRPWGVPYRVLQPAARDLAALEVDEVAAAFSSLAAEAGVLRHPGA